MISQPDFTRLMKEVCLLVGQVNPVKEQVMLFYEKLKVFDLRDFESACKDDAMLDELTQRRGLNYIVIKNAVMRYQLARQAKEEDREKKIRDAEEKKLLKDDKLPEEVREFIKNFGKDRRVK